MSTIPPRKFFALSFSLVAKKQIGAHAPICPLNDYP